MSCAACGMCLEYENNGTTFSNAVLVEVAGVYDGGLFFECPGCAYRWHRWPEGFALREAARRYVEVTA